MFSHINTYFLQHHHEDYEYKDSEDLRIEINELFSYEETKQLLESHHKGHPDHLHGNQPRPFKTPIMQK